MEKEKVYTASDIYRMGMLKFLGFNSWPAVLNFISENIESGKLTATRNGNRYAIKATHWNSFIDEITKSAQI